MFSVRDIFIEGGPLEEYIPQYQSRQGQMDMAARVAVALGLEGETTGDVHRTLVIEAETGIGKTLAYLIPAVLANRRVVVSTATINLQDQIIKKDIPLVETVLGQKSQALCLKGRENYLCLYRWYQHRSNPQVSLIADPMTDRIDKWLESTETGDRAELDWLDTGSSFWSKIASLSNQCLGGDCPENSQCFVNRLRKKAGSARILVVNHHLFFSDLALKKDGFGEILPRYEAVIFDEAHHLENTATLFFGKTFSQYQLIDLLSDIKKQAELELHPDKVDEVIANCSGLKQRVEAFHHIFPRKTGRFYLDHFINEISEGLWKDAVEQLCTGITRFINNLRECSGEGDAWTFLIGRGVELEKNLRDIALFTNQHGYVHWFEKKERSVVISATPIDISETLQKNLYANVSACILTSATLSSGKSFSYFSDRLGLGETTEYLQFASPFDYRSKTLLYIPEVSFPEPANENFIEAASHRIVEILKMSRGRALVLCTSLRGMNLMADYAQSELPYPVFVQGSSSRHALLEAFRKQTHSVLFAVASFWEGVDIVGESLSCVIIDKLPFEVPTDPIIKARIERIKENGGNPFFDFQVPRAILSLRQGVGRLIRSVNDSGLIAIMDVRLVTKGYGKAFIRSLPDSPLSRDLKDIELFFK